MPEPSRNLLGTFSPQVRPLPVLNDAFELVRRRWEAEACDYAYACEQLKATRAGPTLPASCADLFSF